MNFKYVIFFDTDNYIVKGMKIISVFFFFNIVIFK